MTSRHVIGATIGMSGCNFINGSAIVNNWLLNRFSFFIAQRRANILINDVSQDTFLFYRQCQYCMQNNVERVHCWIMQCVSLTFPHAVQQIVNGNMWLCDVRVVYVSASQECLFIRVINPVTCTIRGKYTLGHSTKHSRLCNTTSFRLQGYVLLLNQHVLPPLFFFIDIIIFWKWMQHCWRNFAVRF